MILKSLQAECEIKLEKTKSKGEKVDFLNTFFCSQFPNKTCMGDCCFLFRCLLAFLSFGPRVFRLSLCLLLFQKPGARGRQKQTSRNHTNALTQKNKKKKSSLLGF